MHGSKEARIGKVAVEWSDGVCNSFMLIVFPFQSFFFASSLG
jgi:hypothetical protein